VFHQRTFNCKCTILWIDRGSAVDIVILDEDSVPRLSIPERYRVGLAALAALPDEEFGELLRLVEEGASADTAEALAVQFKEKSPSLNHTDLPEIIDAVESIQGVQHYAHVSPQTFASDLSSGLLEDDPKVAERIDAQTLEERVSKLVKAKPINLIKEKISELQSEVERGYCKARILTDVRAAFSDDPSALPTAMTVLHTLRIRYHGDTQRHKEFFVSMDDDDLAALKKEIERAQKKKKALEELLARANCRRFE